MLNLRIARSPLTPNENEVILSEYNRLSFARIPMDEFVHWVANSPDGPAWHGILETDEGRIVGHTSAFPMRTEYGSPELIPAKSEYSFLHEDFRKLKIRGYESIARPTFLILLDELFKHCLAHGWGPIFASTAEKNQVFTRKVGMRPLEFPLTECLLVLRPMNATRHTPNLEKKKLAALFVAGIGQRAWGTVRVMAGAGRDGVRTVPIDDEIPEAETARLSFFESPHSLKWRYLGGQYLRLGFAEAPADYVIAKCGSPERYLRVLQTRLHGTNSIASIVTTLIRQAMEQRAIGVRWAVYDVDEKAAHLVSELRKNGFVCARRIRIMMVHKNDPKFVDTRLWNINDSLFSFDP